MKPSELLELRRYNRAAYNIVEANSPAGFLDDFTSKDEVQNYSAKYATEARKLQSMTA
jgi:hypothetical protein